MTKAEVNIKFPCGYEYNIKISSIFGNIELDELTQTCPLHGKKCAKGGKDDN